MKNTVDYYYNIRINNLVNNNKDYYFLLNNDEYHLIKYIRPIEDAQAIYKLNYEMIKRNVMCHKIILNKDNQIVTMINNTPYILIKLCDYRNKNVSLTDINYMQKMTNNIEFEKTLLRDDWIKLWSEKIDYYEYQINQLGKEYPILCDSLSYYIGLGENAISYLVNNIDNEKMALVTSHKRIKINDGSFEFYNPINFIIDNRVRDVSEYIKESFFLNRFSSNELKMYINSNNFNKKEYIYLFSRLLFPTYYFDMYDEIINNNLKEDLILPILNKINDYEKFLISIYKYILYEKKVQIEPIEWLLKNDS